MDNFCHTLVGAAFGEAGPERRTRFGNPTLMIAANLPDIDVLSFVTDTNPISFRRGWTHGIIAQLALPGPVAGLAYGSGPGGSAPRPRRVLCAGLVCGIGRVPSARREDQRPLHFGWLLLLSYVGVYSHVFLD